MVDSNNVDIIINMTVSGDDEYDNEALYLS